MFATSFVLGEGAYFWENSPERAREWAEFLKKHPPQPSRRIAEPFVIGAIIELGNCLDLTDATSLQIVRAGYEEFQRANVLAGAELPVNEPAHGHDVAPWRRIWEATRPPTDDAPRQVWKP